MHIVHDAVIGDFEHRCLAFLVNCHFAVALVDADLVLDCQRDLGVGHRGFAGLAHLFAGGALTPTHYCLVGAAPSPCRPVTTIVASASETLFSPRSAAPAPPPLHTQDLQKEVLDAA